MLPQKWFDLPYIPPQINPVDLDKNFRLINYSDILTINNEPHAIYSATHTIAKNGRTVIRVAQNLKSGAWEVCKSIDKRMFNPLEINSLMKMNQFIGHLDSQFLMNYIPGIRLDSVLSTHHYISSVYLDIASQLLHSLQTLHQHNIAHRDLHGGNILYDLATNKLNIIDFGRSAVADDVSIKKNDLARIMHHMQACMHKTDWLKQHAVFTFKNTYSQMKQIDNQHDLDYFYIKLRQKFRFLKNHLPAHEKNNRALVFDIADFNPYNMDLSKLRRFNKVYLTDKRNQASVFDLLTCRRFLQRHMEQCE